MGRTCLLDSLNMVTDGVATLRKIPPGSFYSIIIDVLQLPTSPSGPFLLRISEFVDALELNMYHEQVFQLPSGTALQTIQVLQANSLRQVLVGTDGVTLTELLFYSCALDRIPPSIGNMPLLESLTISWCALRGFSFDAFKRNPKLTALDLSNNQIETIQPSTSIGEEATLAIKNLYLSSNRLSTLDMTTFAKLSAIRMLDLRHNNLARVVAESSVNWPTMEMLDLSGNQLRTLDLQWLSAPNLGRLILSSNLFEAIPQRLRRFPNLQLISLSENNFTGFDIAPLNGLPMLNSLDLSVNPAARYVRSSRPVLLPMLNNLYVENCALSRFNTTGIDLPIISFISLANNNFTVVPPLVQAFPAMDSFSLQGNPLSCNALRARSELILSGKLILGPPHGSSQNCAAGSITLQNSLSLCCKA
ncbi:transforming growth factor beta activator LRRC32-like [Anopheles nili]|uniref:transforming growth factor beta activator LRRC32-like n=1 Tax=Anopheles nili TaxID=185578 RepID=UPI00237BDD1D|nr:transforming growth factor beta activator LRRC32-like [Anopheles nili]